MSNFLLHKHCKPDEQFRRPEGLTELLCDITREVLREQPDCVYTFCADYLDAMLRTREQTLIAERTRNSIVAISMTISDLMREIGIPAALAAQSAAIIEQSFRQSVVNDQHDDVRLQLAPSTVVLESDILERLRSECGFSGDQLAQVQRIVQACFKDFYFREKEFTLKMNRLPFDPWNRRVEKTLELYRNSGPDQQELERAAVVIQAAYRSFDSRKRQRELTDQKRLSTTIQVERLKQPATRSSLVPMGVPEEQPTSVVERQNSFISAQIEDVCRYVEEPNLDEMATAIQSTFRGHLARKQLLVQRLKDEEVGQIDEINIQQGKDDEQPYNALKVADDEEQP